MHLKMSSAKIMAILSRGIWVHSKLRVVATTNEYVSAGGSGIRSAILQTKYFNAFSCMIQIMNWHQIGNKPLFEPMMG